MGELRREAEAALAALDRALAARPTRDGTALGDATARLCAVRDALIRRSRGGDGDPAGLGVLNGIVSAVMAGHFPSRPVRWDLLVSARTSLCGLIPTLRG